MMKLFERFNAHETHPEVEEQLPELPEGITIPDDISGIEGPTRRTTAVRWMRWVPVGLVLAAGGLVLALALQGDGTTDEAVVQQATSAEVVQNEITAALAEARVGTMEMQATSALMAQDAIDAALAETRVVPVEMQATSALMVEDAITADLAEARAGITEMQATSALMVEDAIDAALAEARVG